MKFFSPEVALYLSINLPQVHAWNTVVMSGLVPLVATWNCPISYKNGYAGLLVLHLLPLLNPWLNVGMQPASDVYLNRLNWFHFLFLEGGVLVILLFCMIFLSPLLDVTRMSMSTFSLLAQLGSGTLSYRECFCLTYDLNGFKGCVRYIFASLFCISKTEHFRNKEKYFLFDLESSSSS